nr:hypothetical protein [Escherichia coli]
MRDLILQLSKSSIYSTKPAPVKTTWKAGLSKNLRIGGISTDGGKHLFGHVRNLRIWHKELTDAQMGESIK